MAKLPDGEIRVILPTYRRDAGLADAIERLAQQTVPPVEVLVVDNAARPACEQRSRKLARSAPFEVTYVAAADNGGPAGATALGMELLLPRMQDHDWIARADDDLPTVPDDLFQRLLGVACEVVNLEVVGGIGRNGAHWDPRRALFDEGASSWTGISEVDYLVTGYLPLYRVGAVREVGVFRPELFFGLTEAEYGLRLRRHGYTLLRVDGGGRPRRSPQRTVTSPTWRRYYSNRNRILLAREYGTPTAALQVILTLVAKPLLNLPRRPAVAADALRWNLRSIRDALLGRLGRTVEPGTVDGELDRRGRPAEREPRWTRRSRAGRP